MEGIIITGIVFFFVYKVIEFSVLQNNRKHLINRMSQISPETFQSNINALNDAQNSKSNGNRFSSLRWGVLALSVGLGWFLGELMYWEAYNVGHHISRESMIIPPTAIFAGIALIVVYFIEKKDFKKTKSGE